MQAQLARAHQLAYTFFSDFLRDGPTPAVLAQARASSTLAAALAEPRDTHADRDALWAEHEHVFGYCVYPYSGVYLSPETQVGHDRRLINLYAQFGCGPGPDEPEPEPEHLANILRVLASLCRAHNLAGQQQLLNYLASWISVWTDAVVRCQRPVSAAFACLVRDTIYLHRQGLASAQLLDLPPAPTLDLKSPQTTLADIADHLLTPLATGVFLSRHDLASLARRLQLPCGFGGRALLLRNLLRSAARFGSLTAVCEQLAALWEQVLATRHPDCPWAPRLRTTLHHLASIRLAGENRATTDVPAEAL